MKKKRITYGVPGMMEYQALIKVGKATLKVPFTDGSMTAFGENPAQFTTTNFIVQHAIENSFDYKRGRIKTVNVIELDEDVKIERNETKATSAESGEVAVGATATDSQSAESGEADEVAVGATAPTTTDETSTENAEVAVDATAPTTDGAEGQTVTEVEFSCNADAKEYLARTFGVTSSLKSRAEIIACGEKYGVKILFE